MYVRIIWTDEFRNDKYLYINISMLKGELSNAIYSDFR